MGNETGECHFLDLALVIWLSGASRKRGGIADIVEPSGIEDKGVEREAETGALDSAVPSKIKIPLILLFL